MPLNETTLQSEKQKQATLRFWAFIIFCIFTMNLVMAISRFLRLMFRVNRTNLDSIEDYMARGREERQTRYTTMEEAIRARVVKEEERIQAILDEFEVFSDDEADDEILRKPRVRIIKIIPRRRISRESGSEAPEDEQN